MGLHINIQNKPGIKNNNKKSCLFCSGSHHKIDSCIKFLQLTLKQRFEYLKVNKICVKCLKSSHNFDTCDSTCKLCQGESQVSKLWEDFKHLTHILLTFSPC